MDPQDQGSDVLSTGALPRPESELKSHISEQEPKGSKKGLIALILAGTITITATVVAAVIFLTNFGGLQTYTNDQPAFSFGYPEGWQTEKSANQIFITPEALSNPSSSFSPEIIVSIINDPTITNVEVFETLYPEVIESKAEIESAEYTLRTKSQTEVNGNTAFLVVADGKGNDDQPLQRVEYYVYFNDSIISFLFITDEENKGLVDVFERGLNKLN